MWAPRRAFVAQVAGVGRRQVHPGRHLLRHGDAEPAELGGLVGVVAEQRDRVHVQRRQHLRGHRVVPLVLGMAEREVRLVRVEARVLQQVRVELAVQTDAAALLAQVQQIPAGFGNPLDRLAELRAAVATLAAEDVAGEAFAVRPDQRHRRRCSTRLERLRVPAEAQRQMFEAVDESVEGQHPGGRGVPVGEPERDHHLPTDACGGQRWRHQTSSSGSARKRGDRA